jgi:hypothetical protein
VYYISEELRFQLIHPSHAAKSAGVRIGRLAMAKALCNILKNAFRGGIVHPPLATHRTAVRMLSRRLIADVAVKLPLYFVAKSLFAVVRVPPLACCAFVFMDCLFIRVQSVDLEPPQVRGISVACTAFR